MSPLARIILLLLLVLLSPLISRPAATGVDEPPATVTVAGTGVHGLHCKSAPGPEGALIRILFDGETVPVRGPAENGWLPVICAGQEGWIEADVAR